jgi:Peptidase family M28
MTRGSPTMLLAIGLMSYLAVVKHLWYDLPEVVPDTVETEDDFSAERVKPVIEGLAECGVKNVGSIANEICAVEFLKEQIRDIMTNSTSDWSLEHQISDPGSYHLDFLGGVEPVYDKIQNIIIRVPRQSKVSENPQAKTVLISAHYDSALGSVGSSDNAAQVGLALEMLRLFKDGITNTDLIFAFNGAEETLLQGAHAVMSNLSDTNITTFINLEAAGAGGKEFLFQVTKGGVRLAKAYAEATKGRASASCVFGLLFESGIIPAETDYRIFSSKFNLSGYDFAQITNGFVYHTKLDNPKNVNYRTVQRFGENIFKLVKNLDGVAAESENEEDQAVYFDILGAFTVAYSFDSIVARLNSTLALIGITIFLLGLLKKGKVTLNAYFWVILKFLTVLLSGLWYFGISWMLNKSFGFGFLHFYALNGILLFFIFAGPPLSAALLLGTSIPLSFSLFFNAVVTLLLTWYVKTPASYLSMLWLLFSIVSYPVKLLSNTLYMITSKLVPLICTLQVFLTLVVDVVLPASSRSGDISPPEISLGLISACGVAFIYVNGGIPDLNLGLRRLVATGIFGMTVICSFYSLMVPSFDSLHPKRLILQEVQQQLANGTESNYQMILPLDYSQLYPLKIPSNSKHRDLFRSGIDEYLYEQFLPLYFPTKGFLGHSFVLENTASLLPLPVNLEVNHTVINLSDEMQVIVDIATDGETNVIVIPALGLISWNLQHPIGTPRKDCNCYFIKWVQGTFARKRLRLILHYKLSSLTQQVLIEINSHSINPEIHRPHLDTLKEHIVSDSIANSVDVIQISTQGIQIKA